jgi:hypothetical protein
VKFRKKLGNSGGKDMKRGKERINREDGGQAATFSMHISSQ